MAEAASDAPSNAAQANNPPAASKQAASPIEQAYFVPVRVDAPRKGESLRDARVHMCAIDWRRYRANPTDTPMFRDLTLLSGCMMERDASRVFETTFGALEDEYLRRSCDAVADTHAHAHTHTHGCAPSGLVFHMSRCGSTLMANMLAVLPWSLVYSESSPPSSVFFELGLEPSEQIRALRVLAAAMGRPIAAWTLMGIAPPGVGAGDGAGGGAGEEEVPWTPLHMYWKLQSSLVPHLHIFRRAFPHVPWVFAHRDGVEVMASLLRNVKKVPPPDAPLSVHVSADDPGARMAPCLRLRGEFTPPFIRAVTGSMTTDEVVALPAEEYCAAAVAELLAVAAYQGATARREAFRALHVDVPDDALASVDGALAERVAAGMPQALRVQNGMLLNATTGRGVIKGIGQAVMVDYATLPGAMLELVSTHLHPEGSAAQVGDLERKLMTDVATKYSKARGRTGPDPAGTGTRKGHAPVRGPSLDGKGDFVEDSEDKHALAWPALKAAAERYLQSLREVLQGFNAGSTPPVATAPPPGVSTPLAAAHLPAAAARTLPLGGGYPYHYPMMDILTDWNPDIVTVPASYGQYQSLRIFDYSDPSDRREAELYRRAEVPFIARNIPQVQPTLEKWGKDEYLIDTMGKNEKYIADVSESNHFMFFMKTRTRRDKNFKEPTREELLTMPHWLDIAHRVSRELFEEEHAQLAADWPAAAPLQVPGYHLNNASKNGDDVERTLFGGASRPKSVVKGKEFWTADRLSELQQVLASRGLQPAPGAGRVTVPVHANRTLYYLRASTNPRLPLENTWIAKDWPIFIPSERSFFMVDPPQQKGIHCRFGMPGIIAESHYDAGRNFIVMTRGRKRYILAAPEYCDHLAMLKDGPSARHSFLDWSDPAQIEKLSRAKGIDVVLEAGDALYVPSFWFHFIVSLSVNIQCNSRSGTPPLGMDAIARCGFDVRVTEKLGQYTDTTPPVHHLLAVALGDVSAKGADAMPGQKLVSLVGAIASANKDISEPLYEILYRAREGNAGGPAVRDPRAILGLASASEIEAAARSNRLSTWIAVLVLAFALVAIAMVLYARHARIMPRQLVALMRGKLEKVAKHASDNMPPRPQTGADARGHVAAASGADGVPAATRRKLLAKDSTV